MKTKIKIHYSQKSMCLGLNSTKKARKIHRILTTFSDLGKFPQIFKLCSYKASQLGHHGRVFFPVYLSIFFYTNINK